MKRISSIILAVPFIFAACSKVAPVAPAVEESSCIRINANIKDIDAKASLDVSVATWKFAFANGDVLKVDNSLHTQYCTFTYDGSSFLLKDAAAPSVDAMWYAYYPAESVDLTNQAGTLESAARLYSVSGASRAAAGATAVDIDLYAESSVFVVKNTRSSAVKIGLKRYSDDMYVSGLVADDGGMVEVWSDTPVYLATVAAGATAYIVAPAFGGKCAIVEETHGYTIRKSGATGLVPGTYYDVTVGNYTYEGSAAGHDWVELSNGLKFATMSVGATEIGGYGDLFFWGDPYKRYSEIDSNNKILFNGCKDGLIDPNNPVTKFSDADFAKTTASLLPLGTTLSGDVDIATFLWGPKWRMMSDNDAKALYTICSFSNPEYTDPNNNVVVNMRAIYANEKGVQTSPRFWTSNSASNGYHVLYPSKASIAKAGGSSSNPVGARTVRAVVNE